MVAVVLLVAVFQCCRNVVPLRGIIVDQISDSKRPTIGCSDELEACDLVGPLPLTKRFHDVLDFLVFFFRAFARINTRNMDDRFFSGV